MRLDDTVLALIILGSAVLLVGLIILFGLIMTHFIRPLHDKMWNHKKRKKTDLRNLFLDGMFFLIMIFWFPLVLILSAVGLYIFASSLTRQDILGIVVGLALSVFFGAKAVYMLEHRIVAEKRWKKKK